MTRTQFFALIFTSLMVSSAGASDVRSERGAGFKASKRAVSAIKDALADGNMAVVAASANSIAGFSERIPSLFPEGSKGGLLLGCQRGNLAQLP